MDTHYVHFIIACNDFFLPPLTQHVSASQHDKGIFLFVNACHVLFKSKKLTVITSFMVESNEHFLRCVVRAEENGIRFCWMAQNGGHSKGWQWDVGMKYCLLLWRLREFIIPPRGLRKYYEGICVFLMEILLMREWFEWKSFQLRNMCSEFGRLEGTSLCNT